MHGTALVQVTSLTSLTHGTSRRNDRLLYLTNILTTPPARHPTAPTTHLRKLYPFSFLPSLVSSIHFSPTTSRNPYRP